MGTCIIGGGPAGLTAAYELSRHGRSGTILEADSVVGGLARTVERGGYRFDIGGHRFFTKVPEIDRLWDEMLDEPMLVRPRLSRIFYDGRFYNYPLKASNALRNMGIFRALSCMLSYGKARLCPIRAPENFEQWVTNQFGAKLFNMFFKTYTEKVWGCPCNQIGAEWAAQRIKGLNLSTAIRQALFGTRHNGDFVTTLTNAFKYPRLGPGQLWEACARTLTAKGWRIEMRTTVVGLEMEDDRIGAVVTRAANGSTGRYLAEHVFSSMPLSEMIAGLTPAVPPAVAHAASQLGYRDFLTVALVLDKPNLFRDNWIYVHSPEVRVGRIQNFGNWSSDLVPDARTSCLGLEYFVFEGDDLWRMPDEDLVRFGYEELTKIGLAEGALLKGYVVRVPKAYPVYDPGYKARLSTIRDWLAAHARNLYCIGRNGQHRYNNQDHSMATALIAARNVARCENRDPWAVNEDAEYHEIAETERQAPLTPARTSPTCASVVREACAFTLVELLVVLGIVAVVLAILLPVIGRSRKAALEIVCASNLRQLGLALTTYTTQTGSYPGCHCFNGFGNDRTFAVWPTRLRWALQGSLDARDRSGGGGDLRIFWCPANVDTSRWQVSFGSGSQYATEQDAGFGYSAGERLLQVERTSFSYGYNDWGVGPQAGGDNEQHGLGGDLVQPLGPNLYGKELKAGHVRRPAEMIAIADSTTDTSWDFNIDPTEAAQYPGNIHRGGANVLFCDGHVQWFLQENLIHINKSDPAGARMNQMWNNDNEPH